MKADYYIYLPENITSLAANLTMVVEIEMATKETIGGDDFVYISALGNYEER